MQITRTYCDLCGAEVDETVSALRVTTEWAEPRYAPGGEVHPVVGTRDLCPVCAADLSAWMRSRMPSGPSDPDPAPDPAPAA